MRTLRGARAARAPRGANENERRGQERERKRETAANVRHEREQGDEEEGEREDRVSSAVREKKRVQNREGDDDTRFVAHAQHEFAHGSRSKRESSTWFARAGGGRDEREPME